MTACLSASNVWGGNEKPLGGCLFGELVWTASLELKTLPRLCRNGGPPLGPFSVLLAVCPLSWCCSPWQLCILILCFPLSLFVSEEISFSISLGFVPIFRRFKFPFSLRWKLCYSFCLLSCFQIQSFDFWWWYIYIFSFSLRCNMPRSLDFFFSSSLSLLLPKSSQVTNIRYLRFSRVLPQILLLTWLEVSITHLLSWSCWCTSGLLLHFLL